MLTEQTTWRCWTNKFYYCLSHYNDVIMSAMASQVTRLTIVYSTVCSGADERTHQSSLAFVRGIHRWPVFSPHKGPVTRKILPFDDVIMKVPRASGNNPPFPKSGYYRNRKHTGCRHSRADPDHVVRRTSHPFQISRPCHIAVPHNSSGQADTSYHGLRILHKRRPR